MDYPLQTLDGATTSYRGIANIEAVLNNTLAGTGYPVPRVVAMESDVTVLGGPFMIMTRLAGRPLADDGARAQLGRARLDWTRGAGDRRDFGGVELARAGVCPRLGAADPRFRAGRAGRRGRSAERFGRREWSARNA